MGRGRWHKEATMRWKDFYAQFVVSNENMHGVPMQMA